MSIHNQFFQAMTNAKAYGESKRSYREQTGCSKVDKIFSIQSFNSIRSTSKDFGNYLKDKGITRADQVTRDHVQAYLEQKAETCNANTLVKIKTHVESIGLFCHRRWKSVDSQNFTPYSMPVSNKENNVKVGRPMPTDVLDKIIAIAEVQSKAGERLATALKAAKASGMRIEEICTQSPMDIHTDEKGQFGFGYITVTNPKHGRTRDIQLHRAEARTFFEEIKRTCTGATIIKSTPKALQNQLAIIKKMVDPNLHQMGMHSVRKWYAQDFYDWYRSKHTKKETIQMTNRQLGHGDHRNVSELHTYVQNIY